ncbi:hypothetical protein A2U01_0036108 [Trifolium medium]|uniref:Uncharacterized protein n=1 Tax=Trifolium medium TaxID=97028 RepID=A0A392PSA2_9FABA|nr:hypothetical protein [Trifolium medium]
MSAPPYYLPLTSSISPSHGSLHVLDLSIQEPLDNEKASCMHEMYVIKASKKVVKSSWAVGIERNWRKFWQTRFWDRASFKRVVQNFWTTGFLCCGCKFCHSASSEDVVNTFQTSCSGGFS